ncbi:MAG: hypothetical protein MK212_00660, partial [Saprospiraceae bacterium]|nr:hypothetical protein [Saprospiraceae bacterium]
MSRDDHISKLFRDAADSAEHKPRLDLWDRLERRLDKEMPLDQDTSPAQPDTTNVVAMPTSRRQNRWMVAAASIFAIMLGSWAFFQSNNWTDNTTADNKTLNVAMDVEIIESDLPIAALTEEEKEQEFLEEDKQQLQQLAEEVNQAKGSTKKVAFNSVKVEEITAAIDVEEDQPKGDLLEMDDIVEITYEPETKSRDYGGNNNNGINETISPKDDNVDDRTIAPVQGTLAPMTNTTYMYSNGQASNSNGFNYAELPSIQNSVFAQDKEVAKNLEEEKNNLKSTTKVSDDVSSIATNTSTSRRRIQMRTQGNQSVGSKTKSKVTTSGNRLHSGLQLFDWVLGEWKDKTQMTGISYEVWTIKNKTTLQGEGIVMKGQSKIFQEKMELVHKNNQLFLVLELDDSGQKIDYMMYGFEDDKEGGRIYTFDQTHYPKYP